MNSDLLLEKIQSSIRKAAGDPKIGVAFSGGVDSTMMAKVCHDMGYDVTLLTVGFAGSHDVLFAGQVNGILKLPHRILEIDPGTFAGTASKIRQIIKTENISWQENCIAFYYVSKLARGAGLGTVVTANGIDELFCGYDAYREAFSGGQSRILGLMDSKIDNEVDMMKAVSEVASEFCVEIVQPLLLPEFVKYARSVPLFEKIRGPDDLLRKHAIRGLADDIGVPEISVHKRKKALQYGSRIHKALLKTR